MNRQSRGETVFARTPPKPVWIEVRPKLPNAQGPETTRPVPQTMADSPVHEEEVASRTGAAAALIGCTMLRAPMDAEEIKLT